MVHIPYLGTVITEGVRVGPIARSSDRHTISWGDDPDLRISPEQAASLGFSSLEESQTSEGEKLPQSDLWVCSLQLLLYIHKYAWMLDEHGVKMDRNILLKCGVLFCAVVA